jgi:hypothetical protein
MNFFFSENRYINKNTSKLNEMTDRRCAATSMHERDDTWTYNCWMHLMKHYLQELLLRYFHSQNVYHLFYPKVEHHHI